jgi:hypothetical protein
MVDVFEEILFIKGQRTRQLLCDPAKPLLAVASRLWFKRHIARTLETNPLRSKREQTY